MRVAVQDDGKMVGIGEVEEVLVEATVADLLLKSPSREVGGNIRVLPSPLVRIEVVDERAQPEPHPVIEFVIPERMMCPTVSGVSL